MCGIVGWVDFSGHNRPEGNVLARMARVIAHRGPDDEGMYLSEHAGLASRRLAIVDLAGGHQPMSNEDGTLWVTFNGEIYNHAELREQLTGRGHRFRTRCDTEVLVHLYEQYGPQMLEKLEGQFAFGIWDAWNKRLFAARDRFGVRPLFYFQTDGLLLFASEIKALLQSGRVQPRLDPCGLDHFVHFLFLINERTMFRGVKSLPPAHYLLADSGGLSIHEYWDLEFPPLSQDRVVGRPEAEALADELEHRLGAAVDRRMRADVPFAAFLSGGVDSSLIAKFINDRSPVPVPTFTATFRHRFFNEGKVVARQTRSLGNRARFVDCRNEVLAAAYPYVIYHAETPVIDTSCAAVYELARAVRGAGYKVVLTGEGADEAMAGYIYFKLEKLRRALMHGPASWVRPVLAGLMHRLVGVSFLFPTSEEIRIADRVFGFVPDRWDEFWFLRRLRGLFSRELLAELADFEAWDDVPTQWKAKLAGRHPLSQSQYLAYRMRLPGSLMTEKGDRMSMAHSVEGRYPYLDTELAEFCAKLPAALKLNRYQDKYLLRRLAERHLPRRVAWRSKKMFMAPFSQVFLDGPHAIGWELLSPEAVREAGIFDPRKIGDLLNAYEHMVWGTPTRILSDVGIVFAIGVQLWHRTFIQGRRPDPNSPGAPAPL